jgi:hypothetical protein
MGWVWCYLWSPQPFLYMLPAPSHRSISLTYWSMLNLSCNELNRALTPNLPASPDEKFTKVQRQETVSLATWHFSSIRAICILIIILCLRPQASRKPIMRVSAMRSAG